MWWAVASRKIGWAGMTATAKDVQDSWGYLFHGLVYVMKSSAALLVCQTTDYVLHFLWCATDMLSFASCVILLDLGSVLLYVYPRLGSKWCQTQVKLVNGPKQLTTKLKERVFEDPKLPKTKNWGQIDVKGGGLTYNSQQSWKNMRGPKTKKEKKN